MTNHDRQDALLRSQAAIAPYPDCMAPDGAEPCPQYTKLLRDNDRLRAALEKIGNGRYQNTGLIARKALEDRDDSEDRSD